MKVWGLSVLLWIVIYGIIYVTAALLWKAPEWACHMAAFSWSLYIVHDVFDNG